MKRFIRIIKPIAIVAILATLLNQFAAVANAQDWSKIQSEQDWPTPHWHTVNTPSSLGSNEDTAFIYHGWVGLTPEQAGEKICKVYQTGILKTALGKQVSVYHKKRLLTEAQADELTNKVCSGDFEPVALESRYAYDMGKNGNYGNGLILPQKAEKWNLADHRALRVTMDAGFYIDLPDMCGNPAFPEVLPPEVVEPPATPNESQPAPQTPAEVAPPVKTPAPVSKPAPALTLTPKYTCAEFFGTLEYGSRWYAKYPKGNSFDRVIPDGLPGWKFYGDQFFLIWRGQKMNDINDRSSVPTIANVAVHVYQDGQVIHSDPIDTPGTYTATIPLQTPAGDVMACRVPVYVSGGGFHCGKGCKIAIAIGVAALVTYLAWPRAACVAAKTVGDPGGGIGLR